MVMPNPGQNISPLKKTRHPQAHWASKSVLPLFTTIPFFTHSENHSHLIGDFSHDNPTLFNHQTVMTFPADDAEGGESQ
jgi:hypothetical protein